MLPRKSRSRAQTAALNLLQPPPGTVRRPECPLVPVAPTCQVPKGTAQGPCSLCPLSAAARARPLHAGAGGEGGGRGQAAEAPARRVPSLLSPKGSKQEKTKPIWCGQEPRPWSVIRRKGFSTLRGALKDPRGAAAGDQTH